VNYGSAYILISTESQLLFVMFTGISCVLVASWRFMIIFYHLQSNQTFLDTFRRRRCLLLIPGGDFEVSGAISLYSTTEVIRITDRWTK